MDEGSNRVYPPEFSRQYKSWLLAAPIVAMLALSSFSDGMRRCLQVPLPQCRHIIFLLGQVMGSSWNWNVLRGG